MRDLHQEVESLPEHASLLCLLPTVPVIRPAPSSSVTVLFGSVLSYHQVAGDRLEVLEDLVRPARSPQLLRVGATCFAGAGQSAIGSIAATPFAP